VSELRARRAAEIESFEIDEAPGDGILVIVDLPEVPVRDTTKTWHKRPSYWESIAEYYVKSNKSIDEVTQLYDKEFEGYNSRQAKLRVEEFGSTYIYVIQCTYIIIIISVTGL